MADDDKIIYELDLRVQKLEEGLDKAGKHVGKFESQMDHLRERGMNVLESLGIGFAAFQGVEFIKESRQEFEKLQIAQSQLEAGLKSTGYAAGITFEELKGSAESFTRKMSFSTSQIMDMQSILLTFPSVTKATFDSASSAVLDMATRLKTDASGAAIQLGKALQDPVQGLTALKRVGVNVDDLRKQFVHVTDTLARQKLIIKELNTEFGGSAQAAFNANPMNQYEKSLELIKEEIGGVVAKILHGLAPALQWIANLFKEGIHWINENKDTFEYWSDIIGGAAIAIGVVIIATQAWTAAQWLLNVAMDANPIGIVIVAIGALAGVIKYAWNHFKWFREIILAVWGVLKVFAEMATNTFAGVWHVIHGIFKFDGTEIKQGLDQSIGAFHDAGKRIGDAWKGGWEEGSKSFDDDQKKPAEAKGPQTLKAKALGAGDPVKIPGAKMTGQKNITINVKIGSLIDHFETNTTTIKESSEEMRRIVVEELTSAVNDFQVVADH